MARVDILVLFFTFKEMIQLSTIEHDVSWRFVISGWGIDLDNCDVECFALEMNQGHSVVFEVAPTYSISDSC